MNPPTSGAEPALPIGSYHPDADGAQQPADVAVVINTVLRPSLFRAVESVYAQSFAGRIRLAIGIDVALGDRDMLDQLLARRPSHVSALVLGLPYSTSARHGGVLLPYDGGSLRAVLSLAANARYVAYLDDDNEWMTEHLALLIQAVQGKAWAFSQRMLVDERDDADLGVDIWDSVGPGRGRFAAAGGFVDTNCLLVETRHNARHFAHWAATPNGQPGNHADRGFCAALFGMEAGAVAQPTVRYFLRPNNILHYFLRAGSNDPAVMAEVMRRLGERHAARISGRT